MANVLTGSLAYIEVIGILKLLASGDRDGRLFLQKDEHQETGEIYLSGGRIVHAVCGTYLGEPAFYELILWNHGKFAFDPEETSAQKTIDKETGQLLSEGTQQFQAWQKICHVIPSFSIKYKKTGQEPPDNVKLKGKDWDVLNAFDAGDLSVAEISVKINTREIEVATILAALIDVGLVDVSSSGRPVMKELVGANFFTNLENELVQLIGPVASIIIDDVIEGFGETRMSFPKDKVPGLVEGISNEIYDPAKQVAFQQLMLKKIKLMQ
jgi:hypothetical protein